MISTFLLAVVLHFPPGIHRLSAPICLGTNDSHTVLRGAADGSTVISGGCELPPFEVGEKGVWRVKVPDWIAPEQL